jgi:hypothetical protein
MALRNPQHPPRPGSRNPNGPIDPATDVAVKRAAHVRPTHVPQRSRPHSHEAIRPGHTGAPPGTRTPNPRIKRRRVIDQDAIHVALGLGTRFRCTARVQVRRGEAGLE